MVSLCHVLIPQNSSLIVIACIDLMILIENDSQMIAKNKSKVTQEFVEKKGKRVTYTNEERRENSKVKEWEKLGEIK